MIELPDNIEDWITTSSDWGEHPEAREEAIEAVRFRLEEYGVLAAARFRASRLRAISFILDWPATPAVYEDVPADPVVRSFGLDKYKYRVVYQKRESGIWVLAYAHTSREPAYWSNRLKDKPSFPR
jgi:hypothetical protein